MNYESIWEEAKIELETLDLKDNHTDVLIIGGGITGITCAYLLKDMDCKITIIDKGKLARGVTAKTTAKLSYLQKDIYSKLTTNFDEHIAKLYFDSQIEAIQMVKEIVEKEKINCDFKNTPSILFANEHKNRCKIVEEKDILRKWNVSIKKVKNKNLEEAFQVEDTYTFHPLKYLKHLVYLLKDKVSILEEYRAMNVSLEKGKYKVKTNKGTLYANKVIVACHYPFFLYPSFIPLKTYIQREYVHAAAMTHPLSLTAINVDKKLESVRFYKNYIIFGCENQKLTSKIDYAKQYEKSKTQFEKKFRLQPSYSWMNQDIMSNDFLPFIGEIKSNLFIATGYNAWGMTNGTIAAKIIVDRILKKENRYQKLFDPKRMNPVLIRNSFLNAFSYLKVYVESIFKKNNPYYIKIKGMYYGIYVDEKGIKHKIKLICPHMKCNLVFNQKEKTWDCPCHGSRFDIDGKLIEGPAKKDLKD